MPLSACRQCSHLLRRSFARATPQCWNRHEELRHCSPPPACGCRGNHCCECSHVPYLADCSRRAEDGSVTGPCDCYTGVTDVRSTACCIKRNAGSTSSRNRLTVADSFPFAFRYVRQAMTRYRGVFDFLRGTRNTPAESRRSWTTATGVRPTAPAGSGRLSSVRGGDIPMTARNNEPSLLIKVWRRR